MFSDFAIHKKTQLNEENLLVSLCLHVCRYHQIFFQAFSVQKQGWANYTGVQITWVFTVLRITMKCRRQVLLCEQNKKKLQVYFHTSVRFIETILQYIIIFERLRYLLFIPFRLLKRMEIGDFSFVIFENIFVFIFGFIPTTLALCVLHFTQPHSAMHVSSNLHLSHPLKSSISHLWLSLPINF